MAEQTKKANVFYRNCRNDEQVVFVAQMIKLDLLQSWNAAMEIGIENIYSDASVAWSLIVIYSSEVTINPTVANHTLSVRIYCSLWQLKIRSQNNFWIDYKHCWNHIRMMYQSAALFKKQCKWPGMPFQDWWLVATSDQLKEYIST